MLDNLDLLREFLARSDARRTRMTETPQMLVERANALGPPPMSRRGVAAGQASVIKRCCASDVRRLIAPYIAHRFQSEANACGASPSRNHAERETPG